MSEELKWEQKEKLGITSLLEQLNGYAQTIVQKELTEISSKLVTLKSMGIISDHNQINELKQKIDDLKGNLK
jgi:hypothetical protein